MHNRSPYFPLVLILATCALLVLACNLSGSKTTGLHLDSRANDGSISGSYQNSKDMGSKPILFSVSPVGQAVFQVKGAPKTADLTIDFSTQDVPSMSWRGSTLDGLGALSDEEERLLNKLLDSDLAHALAMIPMDLACQGEESIDPIQLAALLFPLQMRFKYQITDRADAASNLVALSQCNYEQEISDGEKAGSPSMISISASSPIPVVIGYFPFDEAGALETSSTGGNKAKMACLDKESKPIISSDGVNPTFPDNWVFDDEPFQSEWGPCDAKCRGACGPDCTLNNCKHSIEERCEKNQEGENDGFFSLVHVYDCGLHPACVEHDACYDDCNRRHGCDTWAAAVCMHAGVLDPTAPWASIFGLNISCDKTTLNEEDISNVKDWVRGFGPQPERRIYEYYDKTVSFEYDPVTCPLSEEGDIELAEPEVVIETKTEEEPSEPATSNILYGTYQGQVTNNTWEEYVDRVNGKGQYTKNEVTITVAGDGSVSGIIDYIYVSVPLVDSAGCTNTLTYDAKGEFRGTIERPQGAIELDMILYRSVNYSCDDRGDSDTVEMIYPFSIQVEGNQMNGTSTFSFPDIPDKSWTLSFTAEKQ